MESLQYLQWMMEEVNLTIYKYDLKMEFIAVKALVMEDLHGSFYFLFLGLFISTMVYIILVIKAKITNRKNQNMIQEIPFERFNH